MNRRSMTLVAVLAVLFVVSFGIRTLLQSPDVEAGEADIQPKAQQGVSEHAARYHRIVSLAPGITEVLFALGLGDNVIGVTRYCDYPEAAKQKPQVGGFYDPNNEAIVALQPDLVILYPEHENTRQVLKGAHIEFMEVPHHSLSDILITITLIGDRMGTNSNAARTAQRLSSELRNEIDAFKTRPRTGPAETVMISTGRNMGTGKIEDAFIVGEDGFYQEIIEMLGAKNAYDGNVAFPVVSNEGIMQMNPDVIIDMVPDLDENLVSKTKILDEWHQLGKVSAVRNNQVYVLTDDYVVIPGPRVIRLIRQMDAIFQKSVAGGKPGRHQ